MIVYSHSIDPDALEQYGRILQLDSMSALEVLGRSIASSLSDEMGTMELIVIRLKPFPLLVIFENAENADKNRFTIQAQGINFACRHLRYVHYDQVETDCCELAKKLVDRFGWSGLKRFSFTGIPRGGLIVLGILSYLLELRPDQLIPPLPIDVPLVVIDDCSLTGSRFGRFLHHYPDHQVIFGHLYSHADLRKAIKSQEKSVLDCLSAHDLIDHNINQTEAENKAWQAGWTPRLPGPRYWIGKTDVICFPWNEPDRPLWNPQTNQVEKSWRILPPEYCLKNRLPNDRPTIPVQTQAESKGPIRPSDNAIFGDLGEQIIIGNLKSGKSFQITGIAADMWRALVANDSMEQAHVTLLAEYDVDAARLRADLETFTASLRAQGLLSEY